MEEHIIILGGDGFCGWPTAPCLSDAGFEVTIVDNLSRRMIDVEIECESLSPGSTWKSGSLKKGLQLDAEGLQTKVSAAVMRLSSTSFSLFSACCSAY